MVAWPSEAIPQVSRLDASQVVAKEIDWRRWRREARESVHLPSAAELKQLRQSVLLKQKQLSSELAKLPNGQSWGSGLRLPLLIEEIRRDRPSPASLNAVYRQLCRNYDHPLQGHIDKLRAEVHSYAMAWELHINPDVDQEFDQRIEHLARALEDGSTSAFGSVETRRAYSWLARTGRLDPFLKPVRRIISHPNHLATISQAYLQSLAEEEVGATFAVHETIGPASVRGHGRFSALPSVVLVTNDQQAEVAVYIEGQANTSLSAASRRVTVSAVAHTEFAATQPLYLTPSGIVFEEPRVFVSNRTALRAARLNSRCRLVRRLVTPVASRIAARKLTQADPLFSTQAEREIKNRVVDYSSRMEGQINDLIHRIFWRPLSARDINHRSRMRTTETALSWTAEYSAPWQLASPSTAPSFASPEPDIQLRLHESAFNNTKSTVANKRLDEPTFQELVLDQLRLEHSSLGSRMRPRIPAALTFSDTDPINVRFENGQIRLRLRIKLLEFDGREYELGSDAIEVTYFPRITDTCVELVRSELLVPTSQNNNVRSVYSAIVQFFPGNARIPRHLKGVAGRGALTFRDFEANDGWLKIGLTLTSTGNYEK